MEISEICCFKLLFLKANDFHLIRHLKLPTYFDLINSEFL